MSTNKWDEGKIEKLLNQMPDIEDDRTKSEVLARLKADDRLKSPHRRLNPKKWMPVIAAAAAILLIGILVPSMLRQNERISTGSSEETAEETALTIKESRQSDDQAASENGYIEGAAESAQTYLYSNKLGAKIQYAVYPKDLEEMTAFHIGLIGDQAISIPVTFLIPNEQIKRDFGHTAPTSFELYEKYAANIDETALGFEEYHPYKGELSTKGDAVIHRLSPGHGYDLASASIEVYTDSLKDTFYGFQEVRFENEDGSPAVFDQIGHPDPLDLTNGRKEVNYYVYDQADGGQFMSSNFSKTFANVEEALHQMKVNPNDLFHSAIPENIDFEIISGSGATVVKFTQPVDLEAMEPKQANQMIDGMALTAASFEKQIQFENIKQANWNGLDLTKPLPLPIGSNLLPFLVK